MKVGKNEVKRLFCSLLAATILSFTAIGSSPAVASSPSPQPDSPTYFRTSALGDLRDLEKDVADFQRALAKGGILRLIGNAAEIAFNIGQLESLTPPVKYEKAWKKELANLDKLTSQLTEDIGNGSVSKTKSTLAKVIKSMKALKAIASNVK